MNEVVLRCRVENSWWDGSAGVEPSVEGLLTFKSRGGSDLELPFSIDRENVSKEVMSVLEKADGSHKEVVVRGSLDYTTEDECNVSLIVKELRLGTKDDK